MRTLAEQALRETAVVSDDVIGTIKAIIAEIDKKLTDQVNLILHNERFQQVESAWRGLHYLVSNTETDEMLKIRVMNISKKDLGKTLKKYKGAAWDQSPLFKKLYEQEYGQLGGEPYGCLVGDYYFDHTPPDVELLGQMAQIAAAAHAPFIAAAAPRSWAWTRGRSSRIRAIWPRSFSAPDYAAWRSLRESDDAKYVGLAMPRFLARLPYGAKTSPVEEFDFEEETGSGDHTQVHLGQCRLCDGGEHQPLVQALWLVLVDPRRGVGRRRRRPAGAHVPERRRRRGHEVPHGDRDQRSARGGARELRA